MGLFSWNKKEVKETEEVNETNEDKKSEIENDFDKRYKIDNKDNHIEKQAMESYKNKEAEQNTDTEDDEKDSAPERTHENNGRNLEEDEDER
jgi:hypothetical protein